MQDVAGIPGEMPSAVHQAYPRIQDGCPIDVSGREYTDYSDPASSMCLRAMKLRLGIIILEAYQTVRQTPKWSLSTHGTRWMGLQGAPWPKEAGRRSRCPPDAATNMPPTKTPVDHPPILHEGQNPAPPLSSPAYRC